MNNINEIIENIRKSGLFTIDQISVINYAMYIPGIKSELIIDPTIPSEYMSMYIRLMINGIDVTKYIKNNWQLIETPVKDLENAIIAENKHIILQSKQKLKKKNYNN